MFENFSLVLVNVNTNVNESFLDYVRVLSITDLSVNLSDILG